MTHLAIVKLHVKDLDDAIDFYRQVTGFTLGNRVEIGDFCEQILEAKDGTGAAIALVRQAGEPVIGEAMLVFETDSLTDFTERVAAAGGEMTQAAQHLPQLGLSFAFFTDPEGHQIEAIERDA